MGTEEERFGEQAYENSLDAYAKAVSEASRGDYKSDLEPWERHAEKLEMQVKENMGEFRERFTQGYQTLFSQVMERLGKGEGKQAPDMSAYLLKQETLELLNDSESLAQRFQKGESFQDIMGLEPETMMEFYDAAVDLYEAEKWEEATNGFVFMTTINPYISEFWVGLGMSLMNQREHEKALDPFRWAIVVGPGEVQNYLYAIDCCLAMGNESLARSFVENANQIADEVGEELAHLKKDAKELEAYINEKVSGR